MSLGQSCIRSDNTIKTIFDDEKLLIRFANVFLLENLALKKNAQFLPPSLHNSKGRRFDSDLRIGDHSKHVWIEFQTTRRRDQEKRTCVYSGVQIAGQVSPGQADYSNIKKSITITICDHKINKDKTEDYYRVVDANHIVHIYFEVEGFLLAYKSLKPKNLSSKEQLFLVISKPEDYEKLISLNKIENIDELALELLNNYRLYQLARLETKIMKRKIDSIDLSNESPKGVDKISESALEYLKSHPFSSQDTFLTIFERLLSKKVLVDMYDDQCSKEKSPKISKRANTSDNKLNDQVKTRYNNLIKRGSSQVETAILLCQNNYSNNKILRSTTLNIRDVQLIREMYHMCQNDRDVKKITTSCSIVLPRIDGTKAGVLPKKIDKDNSENEKVESLKSTRKRKALSIVNR